MSERKTAEIKFRCTPSFKAHVQTAAAAAGESMSEYIESAVWALQNAALDGTVLLDSAIAAFEAEKAGCPNAGKPCNCTGACQRPVGAPAPNAKWSQATTLTTDPSKALTLTSGGACSCRPWEFCTHKARA